MKTSSLILCLLALAGLLAAPLASSAANLVVTNLADSGPGTLRSALTNADSGAVITFDPSLSGATNILTSGELLISTNLTIDASALPGGFHISGNQYLRVFEVAANTVVTLNSLTIIGGYTAADVGGIFNSGTLTLTNCTLSGNSGLSGGGIGNVGNLTLNQCTLSGNSATGGGGGIYNSGTLTLNQCTLSGNSTLSFGNGGGGIFNELGTVTLNQCTLSGNSALGNGGEGGGIYNGDGTPTLNQCTLSGNSARFGGGIFNGDRTLTLNQCTLSGNYAAAYGGGIHSVGSRAMITMTNTIVAGNSGGLGADISGGILTYGGSNLVQSVDTSRPITGPAPLTNAPDLAPLGNYGGPTQTMPPLPGSPTIDAGSNAATNNFATDQRGLPRFVGPQVDIGAVEFQASPVVINADSGPGSLRYAIVNATNNVTITFDPSLSGATITLGSTLTINTNLTIDASALPGGLQINGNGTVTVFVVASTVFLNSLTIAGGYSATNSATIYVGGGGIANYGTLTLTNCTLSGNSATDYGGGIFNYGTLTLTSCTLSGNSAGHGGGIFNISWLTLNQCTLSGNSATNEGGGIFNKASLTMSQCTLSGNSAGIGGGIYNYGPGGIATLNQCILSGNSAIIAYYGGGGIFNFFGTLALNQCTLSGNSAADAGGGIYNDHGALGMTNTVVGGNSGGSPADIFTIGNLTYGGSNLVQSVHGSPFFTGPAPLTNAPDLAPLGNYGGPTQTMPPLPGSPAIGAGSVAANNFSTDQRGYSRTQNGLIDLGAVELQSPAANPPVLENITVPAGGGSGLQFTFTSASVADFTVLTVTNVSLALTNWTVLGEVQQVAPGQYQFTDPQAATNLMRFYRVRSP